MKQEDKEIIRDLLMYLAGAIDSSAFIPAHANAFSYVRAELKKVYDSNLDKIVDRHGFIKLASKVIGTNKSVKNKEDESSLTPIHELEFSVRTENCLKAERIYYLEQLIRWGESSLIKIPNLGQRSLKEIKDKIKSMNLSLSDNKNARHDNK